MLRRIAVPLAFALVAIPLVAALIIYAGADGDDDHSSSDATPSGPGGRGEGVLRDCGDSELDPLPSDRRDEQTLDEAAADLEASLKRPVPVPSPPSSPDEWSFSVDRVALFAPDDDGSGTRQLSEEGAAIVYERNEQVLVSITYQAIPHCHDRFGENATSVSTGASSVEVGLSISTGGRSVSGFGEEERTFSYEGVRGSFQLPTEPGLFVTVVVEWDTANAPEEDIKILELQNWVRAVLLAGEALEE